MKKRGKTIPQPHYVRKLRYLWRIGALPRNGFTKVDMLHDDGCALLTHEGMCHFQPKVKIRYPLDSTRQN